MRCMELGLDVNDNCDKFIEIITKTINIMKTINFIVGVQLINILHIQLY